MSGISDRSAELFTYECYPSGMQMMQKSGLESLFPEADKVDPKAFEPCGYSMNVIIQVPFYIRMYVPVYIPVYMYHFIYVCMHQLIYVCTVCTSLYIRMYVYQFNSTISYSLLSVAT